MGENEDRLLKKRFMELAARADNQGYWTQTAFLNPAEQSLLLTMRLPLPPVFYGGYPYAERRIAAFGREELLGIPYTPPVVCLCMEPVSQKFADPLSHRDFLGALMGLGLEREVFGDILLQGNAGYVFCLDTMAPFIQENLTQVKRTSIRCFPAPPPTQACQIPDVTPFLVPSLRLDALVAAVYDLSRSQGKALVESEKVFVEGRLVRSASESIREGAKVSVRGYGRFQYEGILGETRKKRLRVGIRVFGKA